MSDLFFEEDKAWKAVDTAFTILLIAFAGFVIFLWAWRIFS